MTGMLDDSLGGNPPKARKVVEGLASTQRSLADAVLGLPRPMKRAIAVGLDVAFCAISVLVAFYLRLDQWIVPHGTQWLAFLLAIVIAVPIFGVSGLYRAIFRYSGTAALITIVQAAVVYGVAYASIITLMQIDNVPRTVGLIQPVILFLFVAASRVLVSWWLGGTYKQLIGDDSRKVVMIYGAGSAGRQLFRGLSSTEMKVVGFIDDDLGLQGRVLLGKPIYRSTEIENLVERLGLTDILLALPSASRRRRNEILELIRPLNVKVRTVPGLTDVANGKVTTSDLRELDIDDLLGREPVEPDAFLLGSKIEGKIVLVSGAGGSIGSELCRQILDQGPSTLLLIEMNEAALYSVHHELEARLQISAVDTAIVPLLASATDVERIRAIFAAWRPDIIYHAAAYKHVPLVEHNPAQGVWNNVFGTLFMATLAREYGVGDFVLISTDKAVRPTNVMGASKRMAELVLQALAAEGGAPRFSMVRFGNVLGSSGSVVPLFRRQIRAGGPITLTHPDINRYFMTIPEAAQLVIQAAAMAEGGEVFVLDMGEPVRIADLARRMVELSGLKIREPGSPDGDIEIAVTGLRPGEKLYEELLIGNNPEATSHQRIMKANESFLPWSSLQRQLGRLRETIENSDTAETIEIVKELVPECKLTSRLVDFVYLREATKAESVARRDDRAPDRLIQPQGGI